LQQRQRGTTWLAADYGGWLSYAVVTPASFIVERWRKRQLWVAAMIAEAYVRVRATSCCRPTGRGSAVRWRSGKQDNIVHLTDGNSLYGSVTWSTEADVARPPRTVSSAWRREVASNGGRGEAPVRCVFAMATARQPARGPDSVVPLCRTVDYIAAALWRQVLHGGGLLGAGLSVSLVFLSVLDRALVATSRAGEGCLSHRLGLARPALPRGVVLTALQSNRSGPLKVVSSFFSC